MSTKSIVEAEFAKIEKQNEIESKQESERDLVHDQMIFKESLKKWEASDKSEPEPKREDFNGAWQKLLAEKQKEANTEVEAFEKEVYEGLGMKSHK